jgi:hypothetical protein
MRTSTFDDLQRPAMLDAAAEHGVLLRRRAAERHGAGYVVAQLEARRWRSPTPAVIVLHNGPLTSQQRMWVALLSAPPGSMLHGLSAAVHDGLRGFNPDALSIVVPGPSRSRRNARLDLPADWEVQVRWSTKLGAEDVNLSVVPPRTRLARSVVDAASERVPERRSRVIVIAAVQQRLVGAPSLWDTLSRRGRCRNRAIIAESILDATGGIQSLPEREFALICRRLKLPEPERQQILSTPSGTYFLDTTWLRWGVRAEIHGIPHHNITRWDEDLMRLNDISIEGGGLLVFSSYATRHLADRVARQLLRMFENRGWQPH